MNAVATQARGTRRIVVVVLAAALVAAGVAAGRAHASRPVSTVAAVEAAQVPAPGALSTAWYCPGLPTTFKTTDQTVTLTNLGTSAAQAVATVNPDQGGASVARTLSVPARSVVTLDRSTLARRGKPGAGSAVHAVVPDGPLVVEPFSSDVVVSAGLDSSDALATGPCANTAASDWYFAAGTTVRGVSQWLVLDDPFAADARVDISLRTDGGLQLLPSLTGLDVPGRSRVIVPIHQFAVRRARVAVEVHASIGRVVATQTLQFAPASGPTGVATSLGALSPSSAWWFTDGDTRTGASQIVAIADVGELDARVNVQAQAATRAIVRPVSLTVPSGGVTWVQIGGCATTKTTCVDVPARTGYVLLVQSDAGAPIVAQTLTRLDGERRTTLGAATSMGATAPSKQFVIPRTRATNQRSDSIALTNSGVDAAHVSVEIVHGGHVDRPATLQRVTIASGERFVVALGTDAALRHVDGAMIISSDVAIFAEYTIYAASDASRAPAIPSH